MAALSSARLAVAQTQTDPLLNYDAIGLAELVHKKQVSPKELVEATIRRIRKEKRDQVAVWLFSFFVMEFFYLSPIEFTNIGKSSSSPALVRS